ncbi:hydroxyacid dehydrogenase [Vibrio nitrifigilis]|uniref:Hydroxyacid dehydrogenase n=1 Tax=Vibrio nitrifigilis TaxID=2789781 RepID=A0ABS0GIC4_9VIBR|nr:hydroxyacid dehydrogenase [Vibrio nitrifigilis]MBF9002181.1 hydroxyacid dehydrogenase [Vibrio nitrifigilis]
MKCVIAEPIHSIGIELLEQAGINVEYPHESTPAALTQSLADADAVIVRNNGLKADMMDAAPKLKIIANHGTGTDNVDVMHAHEKGITVTNTPDANVRAVAEHAFMLMLATARQVAKADTATRTGNWQFKFDEPMLSLYDKTLGIIGWGRTGKILAQMASQGLGMRVFVWSPNASDDQFTQPGVQKIGTLTELLSEVDVVSLHRPLRKDTAHTLNAKTLSIIKPGAIVVNTSRGGLIDENALVEALQSGRLFGAGLDVFEQEPLAPSSVLASLPNVLLTPHVAGSSQEALIATATQCARQVIDALNGRKPEHLLAEGH